LTAIGSFATPGQMIVAGVLRGPVSYGAAPDFPAIFPMIVKPDMADSGAAVRGMGLPGLLGLTWSRATWICEPKQQGGNARAVHVVNGGCG
jgi:hypothetical protein